jgi:hypothetical protein
MMLIGDEPQSYPSYRDIAAPFTGVSASGTKRTFRRSRRDVWFRPKSGQA